MAVVNAIRISEDRNETVGVRMLGRSFDQDYDIICIVHTECDYVVLSNDWE